MPPIVWIDGTYHERTDAKVSVFDHGLLYGDGVFEGIRVYNRRVFRLAQHVDRLFASAKGIWLEIPLAKPALHRLVEEAVGKSGLEDAYIRLVVTRGVGDLGLDPRKCAKPSVIYLSHILAKVEGIAAGVDEVIMLDSQGYVAEASGMNLFAVANGTLKTPPAYAGILRGVTRDAEIVAVTKLDGRTIGSGKPGPTTQALAKRFKALATRGD